ncbi:uncharacterized protein LOC115788367 [Archocentrus centrarchus]|uniref:uncharacterized protein LOC115788367 n=1 Tax=Archocentrus centrarchus TaxID=63155 RepID=UPI0011E9F575|nr:uncharacterized protein LOC115788367 [Archocentrus centrarchus]
MIHTVAMRTKGILILSAFMLILLIPASSSTNNQNSPEIANTPSIQAIGFTQTPAGDTQKNTTFQTSSSIFRRVLSMTTNTNAPNTSSTSPTSNAKKPIWLISILLAIIVVMVIVGCVHHICNQESGQGSSVPRLLLDVRESLRTCIRNLVDQVGVCLWLGDRRGVENAMEEAERREAEEGEEWKSDERGGNSDVSNNENGEPKEEDSDTSDDYSSTEGDNLKERALNRQNEEDKVGDEMSSSSDEGQTDAEGKSGGNRNEDSEELALVKSPQEDDKKVDLCDVTAL